MRSNTSENLISRIAKLLVACVFAVATAARTFVLRKLGRPVPWTFSVLMYHLIRTDEVGAFAGQMDTLGRLTQIVSPDFQERDARPGNSYAAVTFDDGYGSFIENALPILMERRIPVVVFVTSGYPSDRPEWIRDSTHPCASERLMGLARVVEVAGRGVGIGSHSVSHRRLADLRTAEVSAELVDSKKALEDALGSEVPLFAFPYGSYNDECIRLAGVAGYQRVFLSEPLRSPTNLAGHVAGRVSVEPSDWALEFRLKALGAYRWLPVAIALKSRLRRQTRIYGKA